MFGGECAWAQRPRHTMDVVESFFSAFELDLPSGHTWRELTRLGMVGASSLHPLNPMPSKPVRLRGRNGLGQVQESGMRAFRQCLASYGGSLSIIYIYIYTHAHGSLFNPISCLG